MIGWTNARPRTVTAATTAFLEKAENSPKTTATSNGAQGQGDGFGQRRVFLSVYMPPDYGANKEAVMLLVISAF
jgi:hypothetical protein